MSFPGFDPSAVARALGYLPESGSDFADGYFEHVEEFVHRPRTAAPLSSRFESGLGLRLVAGGTTYAASRDELSERAFVGAYRQVARTLPQTPYVITWSEGEPPAQGAPRSLLDAPKHFEQRLRQRGVAFRYDLELRSHRRRMVVASSSHAASVQEEEFYSLGFRAPGCRWGTLLETLDVSAVSRAADLAAEAARCVEVEPEVVAPTTVVLGPHAAAVFLHEAVAHTLEVDTLASTGDPRAALGLSLAAACLTVFDDPSSAPPAVRRAFDDEGIPVVRRSLLREGRVEQLLADRIWSERIEGLIPGGGRRADRLSLPGPRCTHLEVECGPSSTAEIVSSIEDGIFLPLVVRGRLDPQSGACRLDAPGAVRIRRGELGQRIGRCRVEGSAADLLGAVAAVGAERQVAGAGWCAKSDQKLAVWASTPALVLDGIGLGGW